MNTLLIASVCIGLYLWAVAGYIQNLWKMRRFRGPLAFPVIGNLYDTVLIKSFIKYLGNQARKYGKVFLLWVGNGPMVVVMDATAARTILSDTKTFVKGRDYTDKFSVVFGDGLVTSNGETHRHARSCLGKYFIRSNIDKYLDMVCRQTSNAMDEFVEPCLGSPMNVEHLFHILALRLFGEFSISHDYSKPENIASANQLNHAVKKGSSIVGYHIVLGMPMWRIFPSVRKLHHYVRTVDTHLDGIIDKRIALREAASRCASGDDTEVSGDEDVPDDCLTAMLEDNQDRQTLHGQLRTLLAAGHDTTGYFACYMFYLLALHPEIQEKARQEVLLVLGDSRRQLTRADVDKLTYCRMVCLETLRMFSIIPFVKRLVTKTTTVQTSGESGAKGSTITIPKGVEVFVSLSHMSRDPDLWEDPNEFRPERFEAIGLGHTAVKTGFMPFGYGGRTCIGNTLALTEGTVFAALFLQKYRISPQPGFKPQIVGGISLVSANGINVQFDPIR